MNHVLAKLTLLATLIFLCGSLLLGYRFWQVKQGRAAVLDLLSTPLIEKKLGSSKTYSLRYVLKHGQFELENLGLHQKIEIKWSTKSLEEPIKLMYLKIDQSRRYWWRLDKQDSWQPLSTFTARSPSVIRK